ncbi:MAG: hypothetical protein WDO73_06710 [Ignavibacteriota bacterium]
MAESAETYVPQTGVLIEFPAGLDGSGFGRSAIAGEQARDEPAQDEEDQDGKNDFAEDSRDHEVGAGRGVQPRIFSTYFLVFFCALGFLNSV